MKRINRFRWLFAFCWGAVGLVGCATGDGFPIQLFGDDPTSVLVQQIDEAEELWLSWEIEDYVIVVSHSRNLWHYQTHTITVREGVVVEASATCETTPMDTAIGKECEVEAFQASDYIPVGLFALARSLVSDHPPDALYIEFDEAYGFPSRIRFDLPDVVDEDRAWGVASFEVLE